jgi:hypothetical protein
MDDIKRRKLVGQLALPPRSKLLLQSLQVVGLESLSLVVFAALCCTGEHLTDCIIDGVIGIAANHHVLALCKLLYGALYKEGWVFLYSHFSPTPLRRVCA